MATPVAAEQDRIYIMGIGKASCASWLANQSSELEGSAWLLGFWTRGNYYNNSHVVGSSTDPLGVIDSVKKECTETPADSLLSVAARLFKQFDQQGK